MRMIFVAEHKRWEASLERAASRIPTIYEEEEAFDEKYDHEYPEELPENSPGFSPPEYTESRFIIRVFGIRSNGGTVPSSPEDFDDYLDRDGKELEEMLSHMDLDMDREMAEC